MDSPAVRAFWKSLESRRFAGVYYLHGDEEYRKADALRKLIEAATEPGTCDFNLDVRDAGELDGASLDALLGTPAMMAEHRVVVVRDVGALRKDARAALDRYLARQASDIVLVLVSSGGERAKADRALAERAGCAAEFEPLTGDLVPEWILGHVSSELQASITPEAADLLHRAVGNDLAQLAAELDKLASYTNGGVIDEDAVAAVAGIQRGETLGDFLDCVASRDARSALALLGHVLEQPKTTAVSIVMALTTQTLALAWGQAMRERGRAPDFFEFLRGSGSTVTGRPWNEASRAWQRALDRWDTGALDAALDALLAADIALKETRISSDAQILATLVLSLIVQPHHRSARLAARAMT